MALTVAISPCPNDTFSFYHLLNDANTDLSVEVNFKDIEELNHDLSNQKWDICKASFTASVDALHHYELMNSGAAIGFGVGPIAISQSANVLNKEKITVGLPGQHTTANLLWDFYVETNAEISKKAIVKKQMNFSDIMNSVSTGIADIGVLIHEGRFVYKEHNFYLLQDLGSFWEEKTKNPIPLGGIFIRKSLSKELKDRVQHSLKQSIVLALQEKEENSGAYNDVILPYIRRYSQELDDTVIAKHIEYYVNSETIEMSSRGKKAIDELMRQIEVLRN